MLASLFIITGALFRRLGSLCFVVGLQPLLLLQMLNLLLHRGNIIALFRVVFWLNLTHARLGSFDADLELLCLFDLSQAEFDDPF
jgi:hypothetical protein